MSLLVVGSVAFDAVETPHGKVDRMLGGAATYFAVAASFFTHVNLVGIVGNDFTDKDAATRERVRKLSDELTMESLHFQRNIAESQGKVLVKSAAELDGLPADYIARHRAPAAPRKRPRW